jgi:ABC-type Fe3+-citrate transport system substrate-binding protein
MDHSLKYLAVGIAASLLVFACSSDDNNKNRTTAPVAIQDPGEA